MSKTRNPRLDIDATLPRCLFLEEKLGYVDLQKRFHINAGNLRATLDHYNIPRRSRGPRSPEHHGNWKGGKIVDKHGYFLIYQPEHPKANSDGNPQNNAAENLQVFDKNSEHLRHELTGRCPNWTEDGKRRIAEGIRKGVAARREQRRLQSQSTSLQPSAHDDEASS